MLHLLKKSALLASLLLLLGAAQALAAGNGLTVFAAASATNALTELGAMYEKAGNDKVSFSFASSSTLSKQIENGAPADLFLSANQNWMDNLEQKNLLLEKSRSNLLGNRIALIVPADSPVKKLTVSKDLDLVALLGKDGRLSVGDPAHVPVGTYAKAALEKLGLWSKVESKIAPAKDVRAGMMLVERGETPLGIVYASDAVISDKVRIAGLFPEDSHPAIAYPVAAMKTANSAKALNFIQFMSSPEAKKVWAKYGFEVK